MSYGDSHSIHRKPTYVFQGAKKNSNAIRNEIGNRDRYHRGHAGFHLPGRTYDIFILEFQFNSIHTKG